MEPYYPYLAALCIMCASLSGVLFTRGKIREYIQAYHTYVLAFSAGILSVVLYSLIAEGLEHMHEPIFFGLGALGGVLLVVFASQLIPAHHHHSEHTGHTHTKLDGRHILLSDGIHNISDGIILIPAFAVSPLVGAATAIGIFIHEAAAEIAEFFVLKESGYTDRQALTYNFFTQGSIFIGIFLASAVTFVEFLEPWLFAVAAGAFAYLVFIDLIPSVFAEQHAPKKLTGLIIAVALGASLMLTITHALPHEHETHEVEEITTSGVLQ